MSWFLIVYAATGLSVAVSQSYNNAGCADAQVTEEIYFKYIRPETDYAFVCEQHKKKPKLTGEVDHSEQTKLSSACYGLGTACSMQQGRNRK